MEPPPAASPPSFAVGFFRGANLILALVLASGAFELSSQSPAAPAPALALPHASSAGRAGGDAGSAGPCDGGFAPFEPSWRGPSFAHAVDVTGVAAHRHDIGPDGRGMYVPLAITAAEPVSAGATPEGEAAAASRPVFFVLDVDSESNIGHWLIESSVFLREWRDISATYPKARILIGSDAAFKRRTLLLFGIAEESVVLLSGLPKRNYCVFVPRQAIVDPAVDSNLLLSRWLQHVAFTRCASGLGALAYNRDAAGPTPLDAELGPLQPTSVLVVPRGLKGNFAPSSRSYSGFEVLQEWAASVGGSTLYVNETEDVRAQVRAVASARIIVLTEGSAYYVTAAWAVGSLIVVVGRALLEQMHILRPLLAIHESYASLNNVSFVASAAGVMPFIMDHYAHLLV
jgi:hypothetical protein